MQDLSSLKVFVVDDDQFFNNLASLIFYRLGIETIYKYDNGYDCLNNLDINPDIIFLDHHMEGIEGYEVLRKIKRFNPDALVVMVSSQEDINVAVDVLKLGAFDYITKDENIEIKVKKVLGKALKVREILKNPKTNFFTKIFKR